MTVGRQGHYAGAVSRLLAFGGDVGACWGLFTIGAQPSFFIVLPSTDRAPLQLTNHRILALMILVVCEFSISRTSGG